MARELNRKRERVFIRKINASVHNRVSLFVNVNGLGLCHL